MTTWMTPVGVVLIVSGIATLIVFRKALFGGGRTNDGDVRGHGAATTGKRGNSRRADAAGRRRGRSAAAGRADAPAGPEGSARDGSARDGSARDGSARDGSARGGSARDRSAGGRRSARAGRQVAAAGRGGAGRDGAGREAAVAGRDGAGREAAVAGRDGADREGAAAGRSGADREGAEAGRSGAGSGRRSAPAERESVAAGRLTAQAERAGGTGLRRAIPGEREDASATTARSLAGTGSGRRSAASQGSPARRFAAEDGPARRSASEGRGRRLAADESPARRLTADEGAAPRLAADEGGPADLPAAEGKAAGRSHRDEGRHSSRSDRDNAFGGRRSGTAEMERIGSDPAGTQRDLVPVPEPRSSRRFWPMSSAVDPAPEPLAPPTSASMTPDVAAEAAEPTGKAGPADRTESAHRLESADRDEHTSQDEHADRLQLTDRAELADRVELADRAEFADRAELADRAERTDEAAATDRDGETRTERRTRFGLRRFRPVDEEVDSPPAPSAVAPTDVRLVSLGVVADLDVTPELELPGEDADPDQDADEAYKTDDPWLADEDVRLADLPFAAVPAGREQAEIEEPDLSGDFEAVQDTDASGSFPAALDPFAAGDYDVDPYEEPDAAPSRRRGYGDRVEGWVRPEYRNEPASGDYWTPVPDAGYGWPVPVERIPAVPPVPGSEPAPEVESEPTAVVPQWPPARPDGRIGAPRAWSSDDSAGRRDERAAWPGDDNAPYRSRRDRDAAPERETGYAGQPESVEGPIWTVPDLPDAALPDLAWARSTADEEDSRRYRRSTIPVRRRGGGAGDPTQHLPAVEGDKPQGRPRPRPRPRPGASQPDARSTVYVSKHAAEPS